MPSILNQEKGGVAVIVCIGMIMFIGLTALVVDVGRLYVAKAQAQAAADAGALSAMNEILRGSSDADALATAADYVGMNDTMHLTNRFGSMTMIPGAPDTVITNDYVKIGVQKPVAFFFAPIFNMILDSTDNEGTIVQAQGMARKAYLVGLRDAVPWGVVTMNPQQVFMEVNGVRYPMAYNSGSDTYQPVDNSWVPATASDTGNQVDIVVYNSQDTYHTIRGVAELFVHASGDAMTNAWLDDPTLAPGESTTLHFTSATRPTNFSVDCNPPLEQGGGGNCPSIRVSSISGSGSNWSATVTAPSPDDLVAGLYTYSFNVRVGSGTKVQYYNDLASVVVRNSAHAVAGVEVDCFHTYVSNSQNGCTLASPRIRVRLQSLVYGEEYALHISGNPDTGNFGALDFLNIEHQAGEEVVGEPCTSASPQCYADSIEMGYGGVLHIGDVIPTLSGSHEGPSIDSLEDRFQALGCVMGDLSFGAWEDLGRPACRIVVVPIVECLRADQECMQGSNPESEVRIVQFGAYVITRYEGHDSPIAGVFLEYVTPGVYTDTPPGTGVYMTTAHLEMGDY